MGFQFNRADATVEAVETIEAVLDVGASNTVCLIGRHRAGVGITLIGMGFGASAGVTGGLSDLQRTEDGIRLAVEKAERMAGVTVQSVHVNVSSRSLKSRHLNLHTDVSAGEVTDRERKRLIATSLSKLSSAEHAIIHALPLAWSVDEETQIKDPVGMFGRDLGLDMHIGLSGLGPLRNLASCVERCHLTIKGMTASPFAAGRSVLTRDELELGVTVIDMGGTTTSQAVFRDGSPIHMDALPVGSQTLSADIARGLGTPMEAAERIKTIYGSCLHATDDDDILIPCPPIGAHDELTRQPRSLLTNIVRARMEETFEILRNRLRRSGLEDYAGRRIVLTGGGAQLSGVRELAELVFDKRARIGRPHGILNLGDILSGPDFAVATGLLKTAFDDGGDIVSGAPDLSGRVRLQTGEGASALARSLDWLKANF